MRSSARSCSRIPITIAAMLAVALLSACDEPAPPAAAIRPVRVVTAEPLDIGQALSQTGEIQPRYETDLGFRIGGQILARPVDVGSVIRRGDLLARLDDQRAKSQMKRFNLSRWALEHRSFVWYLMLLLVVSGVWSYLRLGREEDPPFTVKTMIIATAWPGATIEETILQVTDRIEKKLQETPSLDYLKSYTQSGQLTILVVLKESTPPEIVPDIWDKIRKKVTDIRTTLPQGIQGPFFDDGFGDTFDTIYAFTADGFAAREL